MQSRAMASKQLVHMNQGEGETSYACNSSLQNTAQIRMRRLIEEAIADLSRTSTLIRSSLVIADLGCSSGPNAVTLVSTAVEAISNHCSQFKKPSPEICVLLNDLPYNDFNMVVKGLVAFQQSYASVVSTGVVPGSFYGRLFISGSVHLICSSTSLHWLSKAPEDLRRNGIPAFDIDEDVRRERRPVVLGAYARQFREDFSLFLELRAKELVPGGQMVVSLAGRRSEELASKSTHAWESAALILADMASKGTIDKEKFDSFYIPVYGPSDEELREIIHEEGSFSIRELKMHEYGSELVTPHMAANMLRAGFEPIIAQHFGSSGGALMDEFVRTAERRWSTESSLQDDLDRNPRVMLAVSLTRKT